MESVEIKLLPGQFKVRENIDLDVPCAPECSLIEQGVPYWSITAFDTYSKACVVSFMNYFENLAKENGLASFAPYPPLPFRPTPDAILFDTKTWYYKEETLTQHGRDVWKTVFRHAGIYSSSKSAATA